MLKCITSKQLAEWMAFATLESVGEPVPPDAEKVQKDKNKQKRTDIEGALRNLKNKRGV